MTNLVLIPQLGGDAAVWARTIAALDGVAVRVGNTLEDDTLAGMARRILTDAPPTFCLAGVSMGGMVALEIMRLAPERVRGLALVDTSAHRARPVGEEGAARFHEKNAAAFAVADMRALALSSLAGLVHPDAPQDVRDELVEMMVRVGAATYARQYLAVAEREDQAPILATIKIPTRVIHGANDRLTSSRFAAKIHSAIVGSEFHVISDCGHLPPIEAPQQMASHLSALLEQSLSQSSHA
jgi:pimeloyl-ACP methyl ester carboxylesterase